MADEHSITYERISLMKFPKRSFSTATGYFFNNHIVSSWDDTSTMISERREYAMFTIQRSADRIR
jgi:hypothetical protein